MDDKYTAVGAALLWLRASRNGMSQGEAARRTTSSWRQHERHGRPLTLEAFQRICEGLELSPEEAAALASAARINITAHGDSCDAVQEFIPRIRNFVFAQPFPCYLVTPWWQVIYSNAAAAHWLSPVLNPALPFSRDDRNAMVMIYREANRVLLPPGSRRTQYLETNMSAFKASMLRHWDHPFCRGEFDRVVAHMAKTFPHWAAHWDSVAATEQRQGTGTWTCQGMWDDNPEDPWYRPDVTTYYDLDTCLADPFLMGPRTDYRMVTVVTPLPGPDGSAPIPTLTKPRPPGWHPLARDVSERVSRVFPQQKARRTRRPEQ